MNAHYKVENKVVVITGAARGIGFALARRFAQAGAQVVLTDVDAAIGVPATEILRQQGLAVRFAHLDVRDPVQSIELVAQTVAQYQRLDIWVNNAGISWLGPVESLSPQQWEAIQTTNLSGVLYCAQAAGRQMLAQGQGVILNLASVTGMLHEHGRAAYSITKAGVIAITEALGVEWAGRGVRVVGIAPGIIETEMARAVFESSETARSVYEQRTPMRRLGTPEEIVEAALYLVSDEAAYITAETLRVDGGWTAYQMF